jgi:hypothetical protein
VLVSIFFVTCVIKTQQRRFKNAAHISWVAPLVMLFVNTVYIGGFV